MTREIEKVYGFGPLCHYSLKQRIVIRSADLAFFFLIKTIGATNRFEAEGLEHLEACRSAGHTPIYALWHDRIFASTYYLRGRGIVVITSQSLDGEYIARFLTRFGFGTVRGSSTRGGVRALVEMVRLIRRGLPMAFTVDGPRGPRHEAKPGAVLLAKKSGSPIVPFSVECERYWTVNSWDRLQIPKPFTRARFAVSDPIYVPGTASEEQIDDHRSLLQSALDGLVDAGKEWKKNRVENRT